MALGLSLQALHLQPSRGSTRLPSGRQEGVTTWHLLALEREIAERWGMVQTRDHHACDLPGKSYKQSPSGLTFLTFRFQHFETPTCCCLLVALAFPGWAVGGG